MAKKKAREDEIEEAAAENPSTTARKRMRTGGSSTSSAPAGTMCDDVLRNIFARAPARTSVASMALSKHHRLLIRCPDFRALHCRLSPTLPHPHIPYVATANVGRSGDYRGFHVAGLAGGNAPMRALAGPGCLGKMYVNTCNGVVLLAGKPRRSTCLLWNPAVADAEKEVTVPVSARDDCVILGLGYGPRTQTYKLLLTRRQKLGVILDRDPPIDRSPKELLVYDALGGAEDEHPRLRTLLSKGLDGDISGQSLYIDGTVYLLHYDKSAILAFDVDSETVTTMDLPGEREPLRREPMSALMVLSGRPCVAMRDLHERALWLLTAEHQWEMRCAINGHVLDRYSLDGVWDCGGVLLMYLQKFRRKDGGDDKFLMYCNETKKKMAERNLPISKTPERSDYALCWGYKPTLISPGSIVREVEQGDGEERHRDRTVDDTMAAFKPVDERHRRVGQETTLDNVCFMEFLLRIMRALPENMQAVIGMQLLKLEDSGSDSHSSSDSGSSVKDEIYHSDSGSDELFVDD